MDAMCVEGGFDFNMHVCLQPRRHNSEKCFGINYSCMMYLIVSHQLGAILRLLWGGGV